MSGRLYAFTQWDSTPPGSAAVGPGDTARFEIFVQLQQSRTWVGFAFTGAAPYRDSIQIPESLGTVVRVLVKLTAPPRFRSALTVTGFARDPAGRYVDAVLAGNPLSLYDTVTRPVLTASLDSACSVALAGVVPFDGCDLTVDTKRNVAYFSQPGGARIAVVSLRTMAYGPPIPAPGIVAGLDLSADGDSLLVALPALRQIGVVDLTTAPPTWRLVDITADTTPWRRPYAVRVAAANQVLIGLTRKPYEPPSTDPVQVIGYDLATGTQRARSEAAPLSDLSVATPFVRSTDRTRIMLFLDSRCCFSVDGQVYTAQSDAFVSQGGLFYYGAGASVSAGRTGDWFLVKGNLFNHSLLQVGYVDPPGDAWVSALSPAADTGYFAFRAGVLRTSLADGVTLEKIVLPETPTRLTLLPGGAQILARSATRAYLVQLDGPALAAVPPGAPPALQAAVRVERIP